MLLKRLDANGWVNLLIAVTCGVVLCVTLLRGWPNNAPPALASAFRTGDRAEVIPDVRYDRAQKTVVLYVKSTCPYCTASMPFYDRLITSATKTGTRIIAVSSETTDTLQQYLDNHHLRVDQVVGGFTGKAIGTPTLLVVDRGGTVRGAWFGQQREQGEKEITSLAAVKGA
jgi:hypothetical protein